MVRVPGDDGDSRSTRLKRSATQAQINACAGAALQQRRCITAPIRVRRRLASSSAASTSANSSRQPDVLRQLPAARSIPGGSRTMRLCWPATEDSGLVRCVNCLPIAQVGPGGSGAGRQAGAVAKQSAHGSRKVARLIYHRPGSACHRLAKELLCCFIDDL